MSINGVLGRRLAMHKEAVRCEEGSVEWVWVVDAMASLLDSVASEFGLAYLLDVMSRFSEQTGLGLYIDEAQIRRLVGSGAVVLRVSSRNIRVGE
jgi:hypothetical protein